MGTKNVPTTVTLPIGAKTAIAKAIENYIRALQGEEIYPGQWARPKALRKMLAMRTKLRNAKVIT